MEMGSEPVVLRHRNRGPVDWEGSMWEYKISIHDINEAPERNSSVAWTNCQDRIAHLNRYGEDGWELVAATIETDRAGQHWVYHWKRRVTMR
jgi:hypothetical protein